MWLSQRGEFDVTGLGIRDGQLKVRTSFAGDITLPISAVRSIEFPHRLSASDRQVADNGDTLIFKNGDELHGALISAGQDEVVKWKPLKGDRQVEFGIGRLAGVLLAKPARRTENAGSAAIRFRNGDWLSGELRLLDTEHLLLKTPLSENLQIDRAAIRTLYFGPSGEVPVWDGAADREIWMKGTATPGWGGGGRKEDQSKRNPWRYLDGAFTLIRGSSRGGYGNGPNLGRSLEGLPDKVEVSFELSTSKGPAGYAVQLFTDENRPGLMVQGSWDSAYIYDMSPRKQGLFNQPQQVEFGNKIGSEGNRRQFRFLADRKTGRLAMFVNGRLVTQFGLRAGKEAAKPGKGITIVPQPMNSVITISNLWVAPWGGALPEMPKKTSAKEAAQPGIKIEIFGGGANEPQADAKVTADGKPSTKLAEPPAEPEPVTTSDVIALTNGDETFGTVERATSEMLRLKCDVGDLEIPLKRTLMVEFAGVPMPPSAGIRLRLAGKGAITVQSFKLAEGKVLCHSAAVGDLSFPVAALSEIVFQPRGDVPPVGKHADDSKNNPGINVRGGVIIRGRGAIQLNGLIVE